MERKIGEIFEFNGEWYQCIVGKGAACGKCDMNFGGKCPISIRECYGSMRSDGNAVIFKKLEKVGEPYNFQKRTFQTYKLHTIPFLSEGVELVAIPSTDNNTIEIEIKQNKEDMKEKKPNMKPFDLEAAKAGKPVCTRDGRKARIICFDRKWDTPIIALIADPIGESVYFYLGDGRIDFDKEDNADLMMLPEKKEGWVNVYYDNDTSSHRGCRFIYDTKEQAIKSAGEGYITTIKIEWEE